MMINTTISPDVIRVPPDFSSIIAPKGVQKRKSVSFSPNESIRGTLHLKDITATELQRAWYTMDEVKSMKRSSRKLAIELSKTATDDANNTECFRGLEGKTTQGLRRRKMTKATARNAVFLEQCRQWNCGIVDSNLMADEYFEYTESSSSAAYMIAIRDQKEAMNIHNQEATIMTTPTKFTVDVGSRRKSIAMYAQSDSMRSMKSLTSFASTSARRLISDVMFQV
jgi:hypothetical protein|mmetsp:Transcript_13606/g.28527  ORF Transcript_13606/g.28527 Transcript_13606/m.28527 type:complete len:225 (+) Transcript_13606:42-716(+)